jgi:superfamily I DNA/RNA helicase
MNNSFTPSPFQAAVFEDFASGRGNTVVNAGAGSGKTTTGVAGLGHIPSGKKVVAVAFNKKIAEELKRRVPRFVEVTTFHSYGLRTVTRSLGYLTIDDHRVDNICFTMYPDLPVTPGASPEQKSVESAAAQERIEMRRDLKKTVSLAKGALAGTKDQIDIIIDDFGVESCRDDDDMREQFIADVLFILERCMDTSTGHKKPDGSLLEGDDLCRCDNGKKYKDCHGVSDGCVDFDDMIWLPVALDLNQRKFDHVLGDEIQDLNPCQIELMLRMIATGGRFTGFGDPNQAIYRFRGADHRAFENVKSRTKAKELPLSICYRCARSIVREANKIVPTLQAAPSAIEGEVRSSSFEVMVRDVRPGDAIISRTKAPLVGICMGLLADGRRAKIQGRDIGASLAAFVKKSKKKDVGSLRTFAENWAQKEITRLAAKGRDTQEAEDRLACVIALSDGAGSVGDVIERIEALFEDKSDDGCVVLSTTHKAKGLEWNRVWMLRSTYLQRPDVEEANLTYVAVTRARKELILVSKKSKKYGGETEENGCGDE